MPASSTVQGTWTAISTPPYFSALALWPGLRHWSGGQFHTEREIFLYEPEHRMVPIENIAIPSTIQIRSMFAPRTRGPVALKPCASRPSQGENVREGGLWQGLVDGGATWVDWIHAQSEEDLLFACDGCVYRLRGWRGIPLDCYLTEADLLADFRDLRFEMLPAPSEAMHW